MLPIVAKRDYGLGSSPTFSYFFSVSDSVLGFVSNLALMQRALLAVSQVLHIVDIQSHAAHSAGPNRSLAASNFLRFGSLASTASPKTAPSLCGVGFLTFVVACSRLARWSATRSALSVSLHFCSFFRRGFIDLTSSGYCIC